MKAEVEQMYKLTRKKELVKPWAHLTSNKLKCSMNFLGLVKTKLSSSALVTVHVHMYLWPLRACVTKKIIFYSAKYLLSIILN